MGNNDNIEQDKKSIPRQLHDVTSPVASLIPATLEMLNKCGAVCKKIPFGSDIVDSVLLYDETKSIRKALVRFKRF